MKTKRILSLFLAGAVICASLPAAAAAGETAETKSEPAAVAETAAQLTAETAEQVTSETAAQTDAETAAQTDAETAAQADAQAAAESSTDSSLVTRTVPFYLCDLNRSIDLPLYFVNGVRDVPFVSLSDWTKVMTAIYNVLGADQDYQLTLETDGPVATLTRENGYTMLVDFDKGTITFEDYDAFIQKSNKTTLLDIVSTDITIDDGTQILLQRNSKGSFDRYGKEVVLDLTKYQIPAFYSKTDSLYLLPLQTLSDFLIASFCLTDTLYNGEAVFLVNDESLFTGTERTEMGEAYYSAPVEGVSEQLARYNYSELCLALDHLYGLKELHSIDDFDEFFQETGYKAALCSTDPNVSEGALSDFITYYLDDLHSGMGTFSYRTDDPHIREGKGLSSTRIRSDADYFSEARSKADHAIPTYEEIGDTAYITFDSFDMLLPAGEYYSGEFDVPLDPSLDRLDSVALVLYAHQQITRENSPIKNVVLDLSLNIGGAIDAGAITAAWFLGEAGVSIQSSLTHASSTALFRADMNLDGEYNEKDTLEGRKLYCLISPVSFSCGNLVPSILRSSPKVTLLGQTSGGGTCSVLPLTTALGACFNISSTYRMSYVKNGSYYEIDTGIEPNYFISAPENLYNRKALTEYIHNLF